MRLVMGIGKDKGKGKLKQSGELPTVTTAGADEETLDPIVERSIEQIGSAIKIAMNRIRLVTETGTYNNPINLRTPLTYLRTAKTLIEQLEELLRESEPDSPEKVALQKVKNELIIATQSYTTMAKKGEKLKLPDKISSGKYKDFGNTVLVDLNFARDHLNMKHLEIADSWLKRVDNQLESFAGPPSGERSGAKYEVFTTLNTMLTDLKKEHLLLKLPGKDTGSLKEKFDEIIKLAESQVKQAGKRLEQTATSESPQKVLIAIGNNLETIGTQIQMLDGITEDISINDKQQEKLTQLKNKKGQITVNLKSAEQQQASTKKSPLSRFLGLLRRVYKKIRHPMRTKRRAKIAKIIIEDIEATPSTYGQLTSSGSSDQGSSKNTLMTPTRARGETAKELERIALKMEIEEKVKRIEEEYKLDEEDLKTHEDRIKEIDAELKEINAKLKESEKEEYKLEKEEVRARAASKRLHGKALPAGDAEGHYFEALPKVLKGKNKVTEKSIPTPTKSEESEKSETKSSYSDMPASFFPEEEAKDVKKEKETTEIKKLKEEKKELEKSEGSSDDNDEPGSPPLPHK